MKTTTIVMLTLAAMLLAAAPAAAGPTDQQCDHGVKGCVLGYVPYFLDRWIDDPSLEYAGFGVEKICNGILEGDTCY